MTKDNPQPVELAEDMLDDATGGTARMQSQNNLKQLGLGVQNAPGNNAASVNVLMGDGSVRN